MAKRMAAWTAVASLAGSALVSSPAWAADERDDAPAPSHAPPMMSEDMQGQPMMAGMSAMMAGMSEMMKDSEMREQMRSMMTGAMADAMAEMPNAGGERAAGNHRAGAGAVGQQ